MGAAKSTEVSRRAVAVEYELDIQQRLSTASVAAFIRDLRMLSTTLDITCTHHGNHSQHGDHSHHAGGFKGAAVKHGGHGVLNPYHTPGKGDADQGLVHLVAYAQHNFGQNHARHRNAQSPWRRTQRCCCQAWWACNAKLVSGNR